MVNQLDASSIVYPFLTMDRILQQLTALADRTTACPQPTKHISMLYKNTVRYFILVTFIMITLLPTVSRL